MFPHSSLSYEMPHDLPNAVNFCSWSKLLLPLVPGCYSAAATHVLLSLSHTAAIPLYPIVRALAAAPPTVQRPSPLPSHPAPPYLPPVPPPAPTVPPPASTPLYRHLPPLYCPPLPPPCTASPVQHLQICYILLTGAGQPLWPLLRHMLDQHTKLSPPVSYVVQPHNICTTELQSPA